MNPVTVRTTFKRGQFKLNKPVSACCKTKSAIFSDSNLDRYRETISLIMNTT